MNLPEGYEGDMPRTHPPGYNSPEEYRQSLIDSVNEQANQTQENQEATIQNVTSSQTLQPTGDKTMTQMLEDMNTITIIVIVVVVLYHFAILLIGAGILSALNRIAKK